MTDVILRESYVLEQKVNEFLENNSNVEIVKIEFVKNLLILVYKGDSSVAQVW